MKGYGTRRGRCGVGHYWEHFWWEFEIENVAKAGEDGDGIDEAVDFFQYKDEHCVMRSLLLPFGVLVSWCLNGKELGVLLFQC